MKRSKCSVLEFETRSPTCQLHAACSWGGICSASPQGTKGSHSFICSLSKSCENKPWSSNRYKHHCEHHDRKHSYSLLYFISIISVDQLPGHGQRPLSLVNGGRCAFAFRTGLCLAMGVGRSTFLEGTGLGRGQSIRLIKGYISRGIWRLSSKR